MGLLAEYVARHNEGVRSGDFSHLVELLAPGAEMVFHGLPVGPFRDREEVAAAFAASPPDDELVLLDERGDEGDFGWSRAPGVRGGTLRVSGRELVERIDVTVA